jgi:hypothetical protein
MGRTVGASGGSLPPSRLTCTWNAPGQPGSTELIAALPYRSLERRDCHQFAGPARDAHEWTRKDEADVAVCGDPPLDNLVSAI